MVSSFPVMCMAMVLCMYMLFFYSLCHLMMYSMTRAFTVCFKAQNHKTQSLLNSLITQGKIYIWSYTREVLSYLIIVYLLPKDSLPFSESAPTPTLVCAVIQPIRQTVTYQVSKRLASHQVIEYVLNVCS